MSDKLYKANISYILALHSINGLGSTRLKSLLNYFQDPRLIWKSGKNDLIKLGIPENVASIIDATVKNIDPEQYLLQLQTAGIKWVSIYDSNYPKLLKQISVPPIILYYKGEILESDERSLGVVGTRKMTGYGRAVTEKLVSDLVGAGVTIVSGLARGVDTIAHKVAIASGGRTLAVVAGGLNNIYPIENDSLSQQIINGFGAVISEFPPSYPSSPGNFPARNRIISGLSLGVLVTEAAEDSGSLITARLATEQGREVFAVPGPITSSLSKGPIDLIKEGAKVVYQVEDILEEIGIKPNQQSIWSLDELPLEEKEIMLALENGEMHIDEISRLLKKPVSTISAIILRMEIQGLVHSMGGGMYTKG